MMSHESKTDRRRFLKKAAGAAGASMAFPYIVPASALGLNGAVAANDRVTLGFIGVGNMGQDHFRPFIYQAGCPGGGGMRSEPLAAGASTTYRQRRIQQTGLRRVQGFPRAFGAPRH